jgi:phosphoglucosamine mutase
MFEAALEAGFVAAGMDVMMIGPLPTPGVAFMTRHYGCRFGVVISASHNLYEDNGIKFFDAEGGKLSDADEMRIEAELERGPVTLESNGLGRVTRVDKTRRAYQEFCMATVPQGVTLQGMKIVVDCAHGAAYKVAPRILTDLGAEIVPIGCSPNGRNINIGCGAMAPELLQLTVTGVRADVGIALDGDGDRLVMVDHLGRKVDGDQLLYVIAMAKHAAGTLKGPVVGTLMTNLGLERALRDKGIGFRRAKVGDRYVLEMLREHGGVLGGETSGHLLTLDHATTGDAMVAALQVLAVMRRTGRPLAELVAGLELLPQQQIKVTVAERFDPESRPAARLVEGAGRR